MCFRSQQCFGNDRQLQLEGVDGRALLHLTIVGWATRDVRLLASSQTQVSTRAVPAQGWRWSDNKAVKRGWTAGTASESGFAEHLSVGVRSGANR